MHIVLVLGAGASLANAELFRPERSLDTHPPLDTTFFQKLRVRQVPLDPALRTYFRRLYGTVPPPAALERLRMEEVFKDIYYDFQDNPTDANFRRAYLQLITTYIRVLRETTNWLCADNRRGAPIGRLIDAAASDADEISVITFNHDLVIENEIVKRARLRRRWCLEQGYGSMATGLSPLATTATPLFPSHSTACDHAHPITIHKLHGSLNWIFRLNSRFPTARQLTGQATPPQLLLSARREIPVRLRYSIPRRGRGRTTWQTWPLIIPPIYSKQAFIRLVQPAWNDARQAIANCDAILFFGYSVPTTDIEAEKLFQRGLNANRKLQTVNVINPEPASAARYGALIQRKILRWHPSHDTFLQQSSPWA